MHAAYRDASQSSPKFTRPARGDRVGLNSGEFSYVAMGRGAKKRNQPRKEPGGREADQCRPEGRLFSRRTIGLA